MVLAYYTGVFYEYGVCVRIKEQEFHRSAELTSPGGGRWPTQVQTPRTPAGDAQLQFQFLSVRPLFALFSLTRACNVTVGGEPTVPQYH